MEGDESTFDGWAVGATIAPVLVLAHFAAATWFSEVLFGWAGGIETYGRLTRYGGIEYAWTNLAWLPGGLLLPADRTRGIGLCLLVAGSGVAGFTAAFALAGLVSGARPRLGWRAWRLWAPLVLWLGWVPVPVKATLTYWITVAY